MPQAVKITTSKLSGSINKDGIAIDIENNGRDYSTWDEPGTWYSSIIPEDGRWVIISESMNSGKPAFWVTTGDAESDLISTVNRLPARYDTFPTFSVFSDAMEYLTGNDYFVLRKMPDKEDTDGVVVDLNPKNSYSYPDSSNTMYDVSGYANHGTLTNGPVYVLDNYVEFDGTDDYIDCKDITTLDGSPSMSMEVTFNVITTPGAGTNKRLIDKGNAFRFMVNGDPSLTVRINSNQQSSIYDISPNTWYHAVVSYNSGDTKLYINGEQQYDTSGITGNIPNVAEKLAFGADENGVNAIEANMARMKLYDKFLSASDVKQQYFNGPIVTDGLYWCVDASHKVSYANELSTTSWNQLTGSEAKGTLGNSPIFESASFGGIFTSDETDDYIDFGASNAIISSAPSGFTMEVWCRLNTTGTESNPFIMGNWVSLNQGILITLNSNKTRIRLVGDDGTKTNYQLNDDGTGFVDFSDNQWHLISVTYKDNTTEASDIRLYVDGREKDSKPMAKDLIMGTEKFSMLSDADSPGDNIFPGSVAVARIYDRELSGDEIFQNYQAQAQRFVKP